MVSPPLSHSRLQDLTNHNIHHYQHDRSQHGRRLFTAFTTISEQLGVAAPLYQQIQSVVSDYDFDPSTPANGYRSFLGVVDSCIVLALKVNQKVASKRTNMFFKKKHYTGEAETVGELLTSLNVCLRAALLIISWSKDGDLHAMDDEHTPEFLKFADELNNVPFYGRALGFQFIKSLRGILKQINIGMAAYSEYYESNKWALQKSAVTVYKSGQYLNNPDLLAKKVAHISKVANINFLKSYWFLSESNLLYSMQFFMCPSIAVKKVFTLQPEPLEYVAEDGRAFQIPVPSAHLGPQPLNVHLYSTLKREGMGKGATAPLCNELIVHFHGGGFVAQSPRSHEIYLRDWAAQLNVPILSVDYSLAPRGAFPRSSQEALYGYMWARKHCLKLGSTGERIIVAGDSAGATLCVNVSLKCLELGLPPPIGMFLAYVPLLISFTPSPSRMLSCMDPMLSYGSLKSCITAYACPGTTSDNVDVATPHHTEKQGLSEGGYKLINTDAKPDGGVNGDVHLQLRHAENKISIQLSPGERVIADIGLPRDPDLSPWWASDDILRRLPPTSIVTTELDPCLDDGVMFARRLKRLGNDITLDVLPGLPHGFLYFAMMNEEAKRGSDMCVQRIKRRLGGDQS